ncbi:GMC oxidoreductase [Aspergillus parasiticus SU-1]|uniref:glucose oxidase n=1 Tax=Aspergillus parasiticus (strain ATCC 56775 / NRRL 5862 / SRRC 143 / SU-1) TaxID=1403190 RepID=A0A0F0IGM5_ASPPU|nr:GMC oxidoreductase [Aspergillus parasiticus SU-1]
MESAHLPSSADYIVVGGGTAGLVVASRLSEIPTVQVLVLEAGLDKTSDPQLQNPPGLNDREQDLPAGKVLGGSSAINGAAFLPPSPAGIDTWSRLGNSRWSWKDLFPYLRRSFTLTSPRSGGPIQVTYPALAEKGNHPLIQAWNKAFEENGYEFQPNLILERSTLGTRPHTATIDPESGLWCSADNQYRSLKENRPNLQIVTGATVDRILLSNDRHGTLTEIKATKEVILAAGAFQTPKLLELSGIGNKAILTRHGITPIIDNPGVGENLQNHSMYVQPVGLKPQEVTLTAGLQALAFVICDDILSNPEEASANLFVSTRPTTNVALLGVIQCHPLSRGSIHISSGTDDPDSKPEVDPRFYSNPVDIELMARHLRSLLQIAASPTPQPFLDSLTTHHSCGTAAMLPREQGGVVDQDLKVYGTKNLRVVDASVFPLISYGNPMATVYAVAERAADLFKSAVDEK